MDLPGYDQSYPMAEAPVTSQPLASVHNGQVMAPQVIHQPIASNVNVMVGNIQQPGTTIKRPWQTGLFSCFDDTGLCCLVWLTNTFGCGVCLEAYFATELGEHCCLPCCVLGHLVALRTKMRTEKNIEGSIMSDCCAATWCRLCTVCQLMREHQRSGQAWG